MKFITFVELLLGDYSSIYFFLPYSNIEYPIIVSTTNNIVISKDQKNNPFASICLIDQY
jgi:hypothetical protein